MDLLHILHDRRTLGIPLILFITTFIVYLISYRGEGENYNYFVLLANAFLHNRVYLLSNTPWLNELVPFNNHFYVPSPPMPAIMLMPFVLLFGTSFPQPVLSIIIGSINVALCFLVILKYFKNEKLAIWMSILFGFGTIHWYHTEVGSSWYVAHIISIFFIWLSILVLKLNRAIFLSGLFIGFAFLSRIPTILGFLFPISLFRTKILKRELIIVSTLGLSIGIIINFLYNYLSFGTFINIGYSLIPGVLNEPWYKYGLISVNYIPIHLSEMFFHLPSFINKFPFVVPSLFAMSIFFTTPAFLFAFFANYKNRLEFASLITLIAIAIPNLMHGGNGFTQFGYRHTLDFMPFLIILTASGIKQITWWKKIVIFLSILINLWGVIMISFLKIWVM